MDNPLQPAEPLADGDSASRTAITGHARVVEAVHEHIERQLRHLSGPMRGYCSRDDFCMGYAMAMTFGLLGRAHRPTAGELDRVACATVFQHLYGDEGDALLSQAVRKTIAATERFAAGMLAGESDASGWQHTGAQPKRLAAEFSLLGHVFGGSTSQ